MILARSRQLTAVTLIVLSVLTVLLWMSHHSAHAVYDQETRALVEVRELAARIEQSRRGESSVKREGIALDALIRLIERAAADADVSRDQIERVWPSPAQRVGDSDYHRHATQVSLSRVTMREALSLLNTLVVSGDGLFVDTLQFVEPREGHGQYPNLASRPELWNLEATVSYLVYAPRDVPGTPP